MRKSKKYVVCILPDCIDHNGERSLHYARGFCKLHYHMWQKDMIDLHARRHDRKIHATYSVCCDVITTRGAQHDHGREYCSACGEPCYWKWDIIRTV